jgi:predicted DNA-binding antitoxin AbrB/MazE fold protein
MTDRQACYAKNMSTVVEANFDGEVFRPLKAVDLPANTRVQLLVNLEEANAASASFLDVAEGLQLVGPSDWSVRVNEYLNAERKNS